MHEMATPVYRDDAMLYDVRNEFFCDPQPTRFRSYCEEVAVQHRRQLFREKYIEYDSSGVHWFDSRLTCRVYEGEPLPRSLLLEDDRSHTERQEFWEHRRNPLKEQYDAGEPNGAKWGEFLAEHEKAAEVS